MEEERGTLGYASAGEGIFADGKKKQNKTGKSGGELPVAKKVKDRRRRVWGLSVFKSANAIDNI